MHVSREPLVTCISIFRHFFDEDFVESRQINTWASSQTALAKKYKLYLELLEFWKSVLPENMLIELTYEGVVNDFGGEMRTLFRFLGVEWNPEKMLVFWKDRERLHQIVVSSTAGEGFKNAVRYPLYELVKELERGNGEFLSYSPEDSSQGLGEIVSASDLGKWIAKNVQVNKITKALSEAYEYLEDSVSGMMKKVVDKDEKEL